MDAPQSSEGSTPAPKTNLAPTSAADPVLGPTDLRASDADRERAAAVLKAATSDGRVSVEELDERLERVYGARSRGELAAVVNDLQPVTQTATPSAAKDVGVLANFSRDGRWVVGAQYNGTAVISSGVIDLREAEFTEPETTIHVNSWVATVYVVVPENVDVHVAGTGILGNFKLDRPGRDSAAWHRVNISGMAVLGNVLVVHTLPPKKEKQLRKRQRKG
jgi:hypothetical protein